MHDQMPKLRSLRKLIDGRNPCCELEVDGGVNPETAKICIENGANVLVAGNDIFKSDNRPERIRQLRGEI